MSLLSRAFQFLVWLSSQAGQVDLEGRVRILIGETRGYCSARVQVLKYGLKDWSRRRVGSWASGNSM